MSDLGPEARAIVGVARSADDPTPADRARLRGAVFAAIAAGSAVGAGGAASAAPAVAGAAKAAGAGALASISVAAKVGVAVAVAALVGAGALVATRPGAEASRAPSSSAVAVVAPPRVEPLASSSSAAPAVPVASPAARVEPALEPSVVASAAPRVAPKSAIARAAASAAPEPVAPPSPAPAAPVEDPLAVEARRLGEVQGALAAGDPARALSLVDEQSAAFSKGELAEERRAARVIALCKLGRVAEARAAADAFLRDHPGSPLADRVRAACPAP
jgi:hypothetical protein